MTSQRIYDFFTSQNPQTPCLVVDTHIIENNYKTFEKAMPDTAIYYAVKANPAPEILNLLTSLGSSFDTASIAEIDMVLQTGCPPDRISYGNTIKKENDIKAAYERGVRLFAVDCIKEVDKISRQAPEAKIFCRILTKGEGAEWPLSRKFGCDPEMALQVLQHAYQSGLHAYGISFHVGSQMTNINAWDEALSQSAMIFKTLLDQGIQLSMVNLGGGFPTHYLKDIPEPEAYGSAIMQSIHHHFGNRIPETIIEPGRGLVGNAGTIQSEIVLISQKSNHEDQRWVYLDIGKFGGLAETMDEAIRYPIKTPKDHDKSSPCILAGPTCDSADILYEKTPYSLPISLSIGDKILIEATGAYTTTYSSVAFNGIEPLRSYII